VFPTEQHYNKNVKASDEQQPCHGKDHKRVPRSDSRNPQTPQELAPEIHKAFQKFSRTVFTSGALPEKTKQLIAGAVAHVTQCPYCIAGHSQLARRKGASDEEIMEAIWVAAEMRAGGLMPTRPSRCTHWTATWKAATSSCRPGSLCLPEEVLGGDIQ